MSEGGDGQCIDCSKDLTMLARETGAVTIFAYFTPCSHLFCVDCFKQKYKVSIGKGESGLCPTCNQLIRFKFTELNSGEVEEETMQQLRKKKKLAIKEREGIEPSTKVKALIEDLATVETEKSVIFSQWTTMMDLIEIELDKTQICYCRLDGTMNRAARNASIESFQHGDSQIILVSLRAGGLG